MSGRIIRPVSETCFKIDLQHRTVPYRSYLMRQSTSGHVDSAPVIRKDYPTRIRTPPDRIRYL